MNRLPRGLIGVVHLPPLPGDPAYTGGSFDGVEGQALADAEALVGGGFGALLIENFGSAPFRKGTRGDRTAPHAVAAMALLVRSLAGRFSVPVGVNCLRNDAISAIGVAAASGASFVRVNVHIGAYVTDQGLIEGEAAESVRYRRTIGAEDVAILADVHVKHAAPLADVPIEEATRDALHRGMADAVVVTGARTGEQPSPKTVAAVALAAQGAHTVLGSGLTPENASMLLPKVDAAIVGTWVKEEGEMGRPVDPRRVQELAAACQQKFRKPQPQR